MISACSIAVWALLILTLCGKTYCKDAVTQTIHATSLTAGHNLGTIDTRHNGIAFIRGGSSTEVLDEFDEKEDDDEDESLAQSAVSSSLKMKAEVGVQAKKKLSDKLTKKNRKVSLKVPYIIRACLNPLTLLMMTKAYFQSLLDFSFLDENKPAADLRSALEEKAKKAGSSNNGGKKGRKRQMKPGRSKTLSDLPALNT